MVWDLNQPPRYLTFLSNANSVPGRRQTATPCSAGELVGKLESTIGSRADGTRPGRRPKARQRIRYFPPIKGGSSDLRSCPIKQISHRRAVPFASTSRSDASPV